MISLAHAIWLTAFFNVRYHRSDYPDFPLWRHYWATSPLVALMWKDACR